MPRLFVVANRLPVTLTLGDGEITAVPSSGGLVSAMKGVGNEYGTPIWIGWPGTGVPSERHQECREQLPENYIPVFLTKEEVEQFYTGYSNSSLWPILHSMSTYARIKSTWLESYKVINKRFADMVVASTGEGDMVWVHDYHLFLVPQLVKEARPDLKVAFFLHTPFPPVEIWRILPSADQLLRGVLGSDLIGFHTQNYQRQFRSCVQRLLGLETTLRWVNVTTSLGMGHRAHMETFPIGANVADLHSAMQGDEFQQYLSAYTKQFEGKALVLSVERLDYSKGLPQRLKSIHQYLHNARAELKRLEEEDPNSRPPAIPEKHGVWSRLTKRFFGRPEKPVWSAENTVFLFITIPSRLDVDEYRAIEEDVHKQMSITNGEFSTPFNVPLVYIHRSVSPPELVALYARADMCLVTPLVDGMNLVAKEYIACKDPENRNSVPGTVVLSTFAGAAAEMFDALLVNPYDYDEVAEAIREGLELSMEKRQQLTTKMREFLCANDAVAWANKLLGTLDAVTPTPELLPRSGGVPPLAPAVAGRLAAGTPGLKAVILNLDDTLQEAEAAGEILPEVVDLLSRLAAREDLYVMLISGRTQQFLSQYLGHLPMALAAEHGYKVKYRGDTEWHLLDPLVTTEWIDDVRPMMQMYRDFSPGSTLEEKESAIVFQYVQCDADSGESEFAYYKGRELAHALLQSVANLPVRVTHARFLVECASSSVDKGCVISDLLTRETFSEFFVVGDDVADEPMFQRAPPGAATVKVGVSPTVARYRVSCPAELREFLELVLCVHEDGHETPRTVRLLEALNHRQQGGESFHSAYGGEGHSRGASMRKSTSKSEHNPCDPLDFLGESEERD